MKVAFATIDGKNVDEHFGRAGMFAIYDITDRACNFIEIRKFADGVDRAVTDTRDQGPLHDQAVESKVERLADCKLVYVREIGGPSAARLVRKGIMPMKMKETVSIDSALRDLSETIRRNPPPWIRKAMGK